MILTCCEPTSLGMEFDLFDLPLTSNVCATYKSMP